MWAKFQKARENLRNKGIEQPRQPDPKLCYKDEESFKVEINAASASRALDGALSFKPGIDTGDVIWDGLGLMRDLVPIAEKRAQEEKPCLDLQKESYKKEINFYQKAFNAEMDRIRSRECRQCF